MTPPADQPAVDLSTRILRRHDASSPIGRVSMAGYLRNSPGIPCEPLRVLGSYGAIYVVAGAGHYRDAHGLRRSISAGDLILLFPPLAHCYGPGPAQAWSEFYLAFDGPAFELWERGGLIRPDRPVHHLEPIEYWLRRFESVIGAPSELKVTPLVEVCRLQQVLSEALTGAAQGGSDPAQQEWLAQACALLESRHGRDVARVARRMGMSHHGFRKRFARLMGVPPHRYHATRLIDRACELMQQGERSDKQIARDLGFCDEFYFSRRFKQMVGCSPRAFRKRLLHVV